MQIVEAMMSLSDWEGGLDDDLRARRPACLKLAYHKMRGHE